MRKFFYSYYAIAIPFVITVLLLFFAVWNSWKTEQVNSLGAERRAAVKENTLHLEGLLSAIKDMETGQRGFLITGVETYLEPYRSGKLQLDQHQKMIDAWLNQLPEYKALWEDVRKSIQLKENELAYAIEVRRNEGLVEAQNTVRKEVGKVLMDDIRAKVGIVIADNEKRALEMENASKASIKQTTRAINLLAFAAVATVLVGIFTLTIAMRARERANEMELDKLRAERADREKSSFLASMSHEIRTPLNAMLGFSELLENEIDGPRGKKYLQAIRTSGDGLANLINDILDLSKIESGVFELDFESVVLAEFAKSLELMFSQKAIEAGVDFEVTVCENCPDFLQLDALRVRQILTNLLGNAFKFTEVGKVAVKITCTPVSGREDAVDFRVAVIDTGRGIPKAKLKEVFKPFKQVETGDEARGGTGLGLSICRKLAGLMNGSVTVKSQEGKGSTFTLLLKEIEIATRPERSISGLSKDYNFDIFKPSKILVVDDNPFNRELVAGYLHGTKHTILFAVNGKEGLEQATKTKPDVILMDIRMPVMSGRDAFEKLRNHSDETINRIPILAVTASSLLQQEQALRRDFDGYLRKPFSRLQLVQALGEVLPRDMYRADTEDDLSNYGDDSTVGNPVLWAKAVGMLREWQGERVSTLKATMALGEVAQFGRDLFNLAEESECLILKEYARDLRGHAESFEMSSTEELLEKFPALVDKIEAFSKT